MPILDLNRTCLLSERGLAVTVICAPRKGISRGWLAAISRNADDPLGLWARAYLEGDPAITT
jgi:hypothetical protein